MIDPRRYTASAAVLLASLLFAWLYCYANPVYQALIGIPIGNAMGRPFGDLQAILLAGTCWRHGVQVYAANACMGGGQYNYSPLLLRAAYLPVGPADQMPGGVLLALSFIAALALLPPPETWAETLCRLLACLSTSVIFALEQSNFDLVIFVMAASGTWLLLRRRAWAAVLGYALFLLAAALKFYPAALLGLLLRERPRVVLAVMLIGAVAFILYQLHFAQATALALATLPKGSPFNTMFGVTNLPFGLVLLHYLPVLGMAPDNASYQATIARPIVPVLILLGTKVLRVATVIAALLTAPRYFGRVSALPPAGGLYLMAGAAVMVLCYLLAQNVAYRCIFLLLAIPGLWRLQADWWRGKLLLGAVLCVLWEPLFRRGVDAGAQALLGPQAIYPRIAYWGLRECIWWWMIVQLLALLVVFGKISLAGFFTTMRAELTRET